MQGKASTKAPSRRRSAARRRGFRDVVHEQGRSFVWLARETGYSESQIGRVARGDHPGSERFHIAMQRALGEEYAA